MSEASMPDFLGTADFPYNPLDADDLFSIFDSLDRGGGPTTTTPNFPSFHPTTTRKSTSSSTAPAEQAAPKSKRQKTTSTAAADGWSTQDELGSPTDGLNRMSHITVERNRRKQMNEHLAVLRSLMPCFYVKRGDQASIIGGVVDYISELQQVLQSLEAKKQRKVYSEVLSPRIVANNSPRPSQLSPRKPPLSPRFINLPISPRTPQPPSSPYKPRPPTSLLQQQQMGNCTSTATNVPSPTTSSSSSNLMIGDGGNNANELVANSKSRIADVEVKFAGANLVLKTVSPRIPGQAMKIISALEELSLEILHANLNTVDDTMLNSFTIKIGLECQLSAEELAQQVQQTFCS